MGEFEMSHVVIHGHDVRYRRGGEGETVLLIHGLAGSSHTWRAVQPELAATHDVIAPDMLGHGESAKPMGDDSLGAFASGLRDFLAVLDVPSATIVGHSFGGGVAMQLAYQHPELCDRLVLVDSGGLGREVSWLLRVCTLPGAEHLMPLIFPRLVADGGNEMGRVMKNVGVKTPRLNEMWRSYASLAGTEDRKAFVRTIRGVIEPGGQTINALDRLYLAAHLLHSAPLFLLLHRVVRRRSSGLLTMDSSPSCSTWPARRERTSSKNCMFRRRSTDPMENR